jgi:glycosyltransferase involved in cell wall biosynthesis
MALLNQPMNSERPLILIPAFNEERTISQIVTSLLESNYDVLVIDDCSTDKTADYALVAGAQVLRLPINLGVGGALRTGFRYAVRHNYRAVIQVDADGQHPLNQIADLVVASVKHDAHLVIGSRYLHSDGVFTQSWQRRFSMWCLGKIASRIARVPLTDTTSGFRLIREPLLSEFSREFPAHYLGDTFQATVAAVKANFRVVEVPVTISARHFGHSSARTHQAILLIVKVLVLALANLQPRLRHISTHKS